MQKISTATRSQTPASKFRIIIDSTRSHTHSVACGWASQKKKSISRKRKKCWAQSPNGQRPPNHRCRRRGRRSLELNYWWRFIECRHRDVIVRTQPQRINKSRVVQSCCWFNIFIFSFSFRRFTSLSLSCLTNSLVSWHVVASFSYFDFATNCLSNWLIAFEWNFHKSCPKVLCIFSRKITENVVKTFYVPKQWFKFI